MVSISSVSGSLASMLLNPYSNVSGNKNVSNSSQGNSNTLTGVVASNVDGDTFQLSDAGKTAMLSTSEMYDKMDADGDGSVTQEEFVAARPDDVTEEMAANLYNSFDTDTSGSLTESEFETAMKQAPAPPVVSAWRSIPISSIPRQAGLQTGMKLPVFLAWWRQSNAITG